MVIITMTVKITMPDDDGASFVYDYDDYCDLIIDDCSHHYNRNNNGLYQRV